MMQRELYFDISSEDSGGSLYRIKAADGSAQYLYHHSTYNDDADEVKVFETSYPDFMAFWKMLTEDRAWFYRHPLFVHPEQRDFVQKQLKQVDWNIHANRKWQESHQRQWTKVLSDPGSYYRG